MKRARVGGVFVFGGSMLFSGRAKIADIALIFNIAKPWRQAA